MLHIFQTRFKHKTKPFRINTEFHIDANIKTFFTTIGNIYSVYYLK